MKTKRQEAILEIIEKYDVDTQDTLIEKLREYGYIATQTTVSRDIKQLKLVKSTTGSGAYKYVQAKNAEVKATPVLSSAITDSVVKIEAAQNIVVVKTHAGLANAVAVCIDSTHIDGIVGSVAGDDTVLLVIKDNQLADDAVTHLKRTFKI
ncbi:MAG: arginine repressor [Clostridia bacterium]|nr:arginine repressor [Clostridia bacterium]